MDTKPDILIVTEANLRKDTPDELKDIDGYNIITPNTVDHLGYSRIVMLAREGIQLTKMNECMGNNIPSIWVKLTSRGRKQIVIGGIYREFHHLLHPPPPNDTDEWTLQVARWQKTINGWIKASKDSKCFLMGDLNIDYIKWDKPDYRLKKLVQMVKTQIETLGFCQLVNKVTRKWPGQPSSIIDHLWTNSPGNLMSTSNQLRTSSDHNVTSTIIRTKDRQEHSHEITRRDRSKFNFATYKSKIQKIDWKELFESDNIDIINDIFVDKIGTILQEEAPIKNFQIRKNYKNWITVDLKNQMKSRDNKRELAARTGEQIHWEEYRRERNACTKNLSKIKNAHYASIFEKYDRENDSKSIFNTTKKLLKWKTGSSPQNFLIHGKWIRRPVELANEQMKFFNMKVNKLIDNLPVTQTNPLEWLTNARMKWKNKDNIRCLHFREISLLETTQLITSLGNSTTSGIDLIDALAIKSVAAELAPPIQHLINTSLRTSKFATRWKTSKLIPLLKSSDKNKLLPSSYRPISILPTISKLVEKAAQAQLFMHMEDNGLLNTSMHAYRTGHSTTTALLDLTEELYRNADNKKISTIMTLDQSAAFDCVQHSLLISKLEMYYMDKTVIEWVKNYLNYRSQFVVIGTASSNIFPMSRGVPQGSVLGPLLYSIFTNELSEAVRNPNCNDPSHQLNEKLFGSDCEKCGKIVQYADDTTFHIGNKSRIIIQNKISENLNKLGEFMTANQLSINKDKTQVEEIMIKQKRSRQPGIPPKLQVPNQNQGIDIIATKGHCRILGMNLQENLTWNAHLETGEKSLLPSLRRSIGALRNLGKTIPFRCRNILARSLVLSKLTYLISIWGGATPNLIRKAQITQNNLARWVTGKMRKTKITELMKLTNWFSVKELIKLNSATIMWKIIHQGQPTNLTETIKWNQNTLEIEIMDTRIQFTKHMFSQRGAKDWNEIPTEIKLVKKVGRFKKLMRQWIKDQRTRPPDPPPPSRTDLDDYTAQGLN